MSPRPQLGIGQYGNISTTKTGKTCVAMARYRDIDGVTRRVKAQGSSPSAAAAALKNKLDERSKSGEEVTPETRVTELAERYYAAKLAEKLASNTYYSMRRSLDNHVIPRMGQQRIREATPQRIEAVISAIAKANGPSAALVVRNVLSGMFNLAARWGAIPANPVTFTQRPEVESKPIRALTLPEFLAMRAYAVEKVRPFTHEERLARAGGDKSKMGGKNRSPRTVDMIDFLIGTGCRAGEVAGIAWADVHLDEDAPWVMIHQQVTRKMDTGVELKRTKEHDERRLRLPGFAVDMLHRRRESATGPMVFESERGGLIDPRVFSHVWRETFKGSEWEWVTPKTMRKTVATLVATEHGSKQAADQLGHASDGVTKKHYIAPSLIPIDSRLSLDPAS